MKNPILIVNQTTGWIARLNLAIAILSLTWMMLEWSSEALAGGLHEQIAFIVALQVILLLCLLRKSITFDPHDQTLCVTNRLWKTPFRTRTLPLADFSYLYAGTNRHGAYQIRLFSIRRDELVLLTAGGEEEAEEECQRLSTLLGIRNQGVLSAQGFSRS